VGYRDGGRAQPPAERPVALHQDLSDLAGVLIVLPALAALLGLCGAVAGRGLWLARHEYSR
jgi:hypothetical protein